MENISYKLDIFEGPLDLLLHLINKHKLDIIDIPIVELVLQYLEYVKEIKDEDLDAASAFLEMAARLVYIKTVSLLPVHEEAEELKRELSAEIIGYRDCKLLAEQLALKTDGFNYLEREPEDIEPDFSYNRLHESSQLLLAYSFAAGRKMRRLPPPMESFKAIVERKIVSVASKIDYIVNTLKSSKKKRLFDILEHANSRSDLIAAFLAVLELARNKMIYISGTGDETSVSLVGTNAKEIEV